MTNNEIILKYLNDRFKQANSTDFKSVLLLLIAEQEYHLSEFTHKGYTSDDFDAMSNEIARLGEQVKHLQELCSQLCVVSDADSCRVFVFNNDKDKFMNIREQIRQSHAKNS
jgi:hypothetical protein